MTGRVPRARYAVLAVLTVVTVAAGFAAFEVGSKTEPEDFFPSGSDFIVGINTVPAHSTTLGPGDVLIYTDGDLDDPRILAPAAATDAVSRDGGDVFTRHPNGDLAVPDNALDIVRAAVSVEFAATRIADASDVRITDGDGFPDSRGQVATVFAFAVKNGVPADASTFVYTVEEAAELITRTDAGVWATALRFPIQGFVDEARVATARAAAEAGADTLRGVAVASGSPSAHREPSARALGEPPHDLAIACVSAFRDGCGPCRVERPRE